MLYFDNASRDSADAYLAEGLTEAIIAQLGRVERLSVKSRFAVRRFRGGAVSDPPVIGRILGVAYLVTGSVQRVGHQVRVTTELARASNGNRVWGDQLLRADDSLFALQDAIAQRVAEGVVGRLLPGERRAITAVRTTRSPVAYQHFLRGDYFLAQRTSTSLVRAIAEYRQAAAIDPGFASALARVGLAYALLFSWDWSATGAPPGDSLLTRGSEAVDQALQRDSLDSDAWLARAMLSEFRFPRTWEGVLPAFERAVALDSANAEAWFQLGDAASIMGDDSAAIIDFRRALAIDPERPITLFALANRSFGEAGPLYDSALALDPQFAPARFARASHRLDIGDTAGARQDVAAGRCEPCPPEMWPVRTATHALALRWVGGASAGWVEAESVLAALPPSGDLSQGVTFPLAVHLLERGDSVRALDLLERASPRGVSLWAAFTGLSLYAGAFARLMTSARFRRLVAEATPPWVPPEPKILDLPIPEALLRRWEGTYAGITGHPRFAPQDDSLMVMYDQQTVGRLLYQGGDSLIPSWQHDIRVYFATGSERAPGFTATYRKRVFPYRRVVASGPQR